MSRAMRRAPGALPAAIFVVLALCLPVELAAAQTPPSAADAAASRELDSIAATVTDIESGLRGRDISDADLQTLRDKASPLVGQVQSELDRLNSRLAAVKTRLDQLGPPPDAKGPREDPKVTQDRQQQQQEYDSVDALAKRARLLLVQTQQITTHIATRQHVMFTHSLLEHGRSIVDPDFWLVLAAMTPHSLKLGFGAIGGWFAALDNQLSDWRAPLFWILSLALIVLGGAIVAVLPRRLLGASSQAEPNRLRKSMSAWWVALIIAGTPLLVVLAIFGLLRLFGAFDESMSLVLWALMKAVAYVSVAGGIACALFAPAHRKWRLVSLSDLRARQVGTAMIAVATLLALRQLALCFGEATGADPVLETALRGIGALFVALAIIAALWRAGQTDCGSEEVFGPRVSGPRDWYGILRILLWIAALAIVAAVAAGFMALAGFLAEQIYWVAAVGCTALMLFVFLDESIAAGCKPTTPFGRSLINSVGLHSDSIEQLAVLLDGAAAVTIFVTAVLLILAPWGIQSSDLPTYLKAAIFGFRIGDLTISLAAIAVALFILIAGIMATHAVERWLDQRFLPRTQLDIGLRNAIKTSFGYFGLIVALCFAGAYLGLSFEKLAIVAGALSVGIGFGLQSIVNNFVSGLILLWERAVRVGDWIVVGNDEGVVSRINVRATEIATFDRAAVIVPNSNLITGIVKNYVRTDRSGRIQISVPVNPAGNPETARDILLDVAKSHKLVLASPAPQVIFSGITASAFNFDLFCFIADVSNLGSVKSDLNFEIYRRFQEAGLFAVPPPASVVTVTGLDKFEPLLARVAEKDAAAGNGKENR